MILLALLAICAGAVWYMAGRNGRPEGNAVLAYLEKGRGTWEEAEDNIRHGISGLAEEAWNYE